MSKEAEENPPCPAFFIPHLPPIFFIGQGYMLDTACEKDIWTYIFGKDCMQVRAGMPGKKEEKKKERGRNRKLIQMK
jgi:hypothetical protein